MIFFILNINSNFSNIDSSDTYLFMRGNLATQMISYNIGTDAIIYLTSTSGNIYAYEKGTSGNSIIFGAHVAGTWNFNIGTLDFGTAFSTYKTLAFAGSWTSAIKGTFARDSSEDAAYLMVSKNPNTLFFSFKPSDLTLISSVYTFSTGWNPVTQVRKAGSKIVMVCMNTNNLFTIFNTVGGAFTSVYSTKKTIFDVEYSKIGNSLAIITTGSSNGIPQINSYGLDYVLSDTSVFTNTAVEWIIATSGADYTYVSGSTVTFTTNSPTISDYSGSLTTNSDITFSSSTSAYFQGYFTNSNVQTFQVPSGTTKSVDVNLSWLTNVATSVSYSLYAAEGSSVPSWITIHIFKLLDIISITLSPRSMGIILVILQ